MPTAHPDLHAAQQQMRAMLREAVARGRSKPKMEVSVLSNTNASLPFSDWAGLSRVRQPIREILTLCGIFR